MKRAIAEKMVHKTSNLLAAIYTFGEPALHSGEGLQEALEEILGLGQQVEEVLREAKEELRRTESSDGQG